MKQIIQVLGLEQKSNAMGKQWINVKASSGTYTVFEDKIITLLNDCIGQNVEVEVVDNGKFHNIRGFYGKVSGNIPIAQLNAQQQAVVNQVTAIKDQPEAVNPMVLCNRINTRKELFINIYNREDLSANVDIDIEEAIMKKAIKLCKQAEEA